MHNLIIKKIWNVIQFKRGTEHSHHSLKVVGNPRYRYEIAAHARDA